MGEKMYCNPINLSYKYQHPMRKPYAYKEAADPTLIYFEDKYFLFVSMCGGFYYSDDLVNWKYHEDKNLEIYSYAPDVNIYNGYLYFCASEKFKKSKILRTKNPFDGFETVSMPFAFWDPHLYFENDRAYLFWGCSSKKPIYGIELDIKTMLPIGKKKALIFSDAERHGIDDKSIYLKDKNSFTDKFITMVIGKGAYIEGAFLNKIGGKYYMQYSTPGTEFSTYADAVCVADSPLGDYIFQLHNPYSVVPSGYCQGAGHGSTFYDKHGNLWHTSSIGICVNHNYERRIGLWPAGVDKDGVLFCNQYFADYPKHIPDGKFEPMALLPEDMLLSYRKKITASSYKDGCIPENAATESIKTVWSSKSNKSGEWLQIDLGEVFKVKAVQVNFGDWETPKMAVKKKEYGGTFTVERKIDTAEALYEYRLEISKDGKEWEAITEEGYKTPLSHNLFATDKHVRYVRLTFVGAPYGQNFTISGLRVFGKGKGKLPDKSSECVGERKNATTATIKWKLQDGAVGYCIRMGIAPDKLYNSILVYGDSGFDISFLNEEVRKYYFAVDTFNENGITQGDIQTM